MLAVARVKVQPPGRWVRGARLGWVWVGVWGEREGGWGVGVGVALVVMGRRRRRRRRKGRMERRGEGCIVF